LQELELKNGDIISASFRAFTPRELVTTVIVPDLIACNPNGGGLVETSAYRDLLLHGISYQSTLDENSSIIGWDLSNLGATGIHNDELPNPNLNPNLGLECIPPSFSSLVIESNTPGTGLLLNGNDIRSLPEAFPSIMIRGGIDLSGNRLLTLIPTLTLIGGRIDLSGNRLNRLPDTIGTLEVNGPYGDMDMSDNLLKELPASFSSISIGGHLSLAENQLATLPDDFGSIDIGGDLNFTDNQLESLPQSFVDLVSGEAWRGGHIFLHDNKLDSIPERVGKCQSGDPEWFRCLESQKGYEAPPLTPTSHRMSVRAR